MGPPEPAYVRARMGICGAGGATGLGAGARDGVGLGVSLGPRTPSASQLPLLWGSGVNPIIPSCVSVMRVGTVSFVVVADTRVFTRVVATIVVVKVVEASVFVKTVEMVVFTAAVDRMAISRVEDTSVAAVSVDSNVMVTRVDASGNPDITLLPLNTSPRSNSVPFSSALAATTSPSSGILAACAELICTIWGDIPRIWIAVASDNAMNKRKKADDAIRIKCRENKDIVPWNEEKA